jgi:ankyrin repeat protein
MPRNLPPRASLEWLRKTAKQNLRKLRESDPKAKLSDAQLALARDFGFPSWRALKAVIDGQAPSTSDDESAAFLRDIAEGNGNRVRAKLRKRPDLVDAPGPHPYWGGRPQPLHVAAERGNAELVALLLEAGADPDGGGAEYDGWSPLMLAAGTGKAEIADALLAGGAHVGLPEALLLRDDEAVARLTEAGLPAEVPNGGSILAFARTPFAIDRLMGLGASADQPDHWGTTPLQSLAGSRDGPNVVRHLAAKGLEPPPEAVARLGDREMLEPLVDADPAVAHRPAVLIAAVASGNRDLVAWLLDQGADVDARSTDESRHTPLHEAAWAGDLAMARLLVERGAALDVRDARHDSLPWGWAETSVTVTQNPKCREVAEWLAGLPGHPS